MAATEVQQPFQAAVDCVLNKLEGKFTLKIEQKLVLHDFLHKKEVSSCFVDMIGCKFVQ